MSRLRLWGSLGVLYIAISTTIGAAGGVGLYTFHYARGSSYMTDDPQACANCHIMQSHYDAWIKSSHGHVAVCNDCHAPHDSTVGKLYCKGRNGFFHSLAFTTGEFHEPIMITEYNRRITEQACRDCHADIVHAIDLSGPDQTGESLSCIRCHADVGHPR